MLGHNSLHFSIFLLGRVIIIQIHRIVTAYAGGRRFGLPANIYSYHGTYQYMYYTAIMVLPTHYHSMWLCQNSTCFSLSYIYSFSLFTHPFFFPLLPLSLLSLPFFLPLFTFFHLFCPSSPCLAVHLLPSLFL